MRQEGGLTVSLIYIYNVLLLAFHDVRLVFLSVVKENEVQSRFAPGMIIILPAVLRPSQSEDSALTGLDDHLQLWTAQAPHDPLSHSIINFFGFFHLVVFEDSQRETKKCTSSCRPRVETRGRFQRCSSKSGPSLLIPNTSNLETKILQRQSPRQTSLLKTCYCKCTARGKN